MVATPHKIRVLRPPVSDGEKRNELRTQAERGLTPAMAVLGISLLEGYAGFEVDHAEAFRWLSLAAAKGASRARYHLGRMYVLGLGTDKDGDRAHELFTAAAQRGEFLACIELARLESSRQRQDEAFQWYQRAAEQAAQVDPCAELEEALAFVKSREPSS